MLTFGRQPRAQRRAVVAADRSRPRPGAARGDAPPAAGRRSRRWPSPSSRRRALPIPTTLSIGVENVTLGGATLARVGADVKTDGDGLDIERLELRAPGVTQVRLSGRLGATPTGARFEGTTRIEADDPRALIAWLTDRTEQQAAAAGPLRLGGDVTLGGDAIAIERLKLELDRMTDRRARRPMPGRTTTGRRGSTPRSPRPKSISTASMRSARRCSATRRSTGRAMARSRSRLLVPSSPASRRSRPT